MCGSGSGPRNRNHWPSAVAQSLPATLFRGSLDTGAEVTAIQGSIIAWMGIPVVGFMEATSSVLGAEVRMVPIHRVEMTFGSLADPDTSKWRTIYAIGVNVVSP